MSLNLHQVLYLYQTPSKYYLQPVNKQSEALIIDRQTCEITLNNLFSTSLLPANTTSSLIYGLVGIVHLMKCPYLIVITKATQIGTIKDAAIFRMDQALSIPFEPGNEPIIGVQHADDWNNTYVSMVNSVLQTPSYYFSYSYDLTNCMQRIYNNYSMTDISRDGKIPSLYSGSRNYMMFDKRFLWNNHLISDFDRAGEITEKYRLPFILGFISINKAALSSSLNWILISRRSVKRAGTRFNRRGIDRDGNTANFVETEQILEDQAGEFITSFVQVRGSIPLLWAQKTSYKYKPEIEIDPNDDHEVPMRKHFDNLTWHYGDVSVVSLIDNHGHEAKLANEFSVRMKTLQQYNDIPYHNFDFHRECSKMRWHRLSILLDRLENEIKSYQFFAMTSNAIIQTQKGVIRSNCIDSLDRTNVVQSLIARRVLDMQLAFFVPPSSPDACLASHVDFVQLYKNIWADNADALSIQYAGTPALKTDFTRTGRRTHIGAVRDGLNSMARYVTNTFLDAYRQDSIDLLLGNFEGYPGPLYRPMTIISYTSTLSITLVVLTFIALFAYLFSNSQPL